MQELSTPVVAETRAPESSGDRVLPYLRRLLAAHRLKVVLSLVALALLLAALGWLLQSISLAKVWQHVQWAHPEWLLLTGLLLCMGQGLRIVRSWRLLQWDKPVEVGQVSQAVLGGQVINWLSPIRVGDVWRVWRASQGRSGSLVWTASSVVIEKSADSLVLATLAGVLLLSPLPQVFSVPLTRLLVTAVIGALLVSALSVFSSTRFRSHLLKLVPKVEGWLDVADVRATLPTNLGLRRNAARWLELLGFSAAIWLVAVLTNMALAQAFDIHVSIISQLLLLLALQTTTVFSPVPGNIGIFPLVSFGVLTALGINRAEALAYGSVLYVLVYGTLLMLTGIAFIPALRLRTERAKPTSASPSPMQNASQP